MCALTDVVKLQRQRGQVCCVDAAARPKQNTRLGYTKDALLGLQEHGGYPKSLWNLVLAEALPMLVAGACVFGMFTMMR